jgi:hypothetical protein
MNMSSVTKHYHFVSITYVIISTEIPECLENHVPLNGGCPIQAHLLGLSGYSKIGNEKAGLWSALLSVGPTHRIAPGKRSSGQSGN